MRQGSTHHPSTRTIRRRIARTRDKPPTTTADTLQYDPTSELIAAMLKCATTDLERLGPHLDNLRQLRNSLIPKLKAFDKCLTNTLSAYNSALTANHWLHSDQTRVPFSEVCTYLEVDADFVRETLFKYVPKDTIALLNRPITTKCPFCGHKPD